MTMSLTYLRKAQQLNTSSRNLFKAMSSWELEPVALYLRLSCLNPLFTNHCIHLDYEPVDLATGQVHDRSRDGALALVLDAASMAARSSRLLFKQQPIAEHTDDSFARVLFLQRLVERAHKVLESNTPIQEEELNCMAIGVYQQTGLSFTTTPWAALLNEDLRWCLACPDTDWAALKEQFPDTAPWLDTFTVHRQLFEPREALRQIWAMSPLLPGSRPAVEQWSLPDLGGQ